jgi:hypothetical protein
LPAGGGSLRFEALHSAKDGSMRTISLRTILLLGFVIAMPVLALPTVARRLDQWLYGPPPAEFSQPPLHRELMPAIEPLAAERVSPASFDEVDPASALSRRGPSEGLDALAPSPPPLDPLPAFDRLATSSGSLAADSRTPLTSDKVARLSLIHQELETLGAEYILLDEAEDGGSYRFHCHVRLDANSTATRQFEAEAADPVGAAEKVLADVTSWRSAAAAREGRNLR